MLFIKLYVHSLLHPHPSFEGQFGHYYYIGSCLTFINMQTGRVSFFQIFALSP